MLYFRVHTGNNPDLFFSKESQYLASSSGDLLDDWAILVTALLLMNRPHACEQRDRPRLESDPRVIFSLVWRTEVLILTLSSAATKPASLLKADMTKALYFLWTSRVVWTYTLGSWKRRTHLRFHHDLFVWISAFFFIKKNVTFYTFTTLVSW